MTYCPGNEAVLEPVFFCILDTGIVFARRRRSNAVFSGWVGSSATARAFLIIVVQSAERQAVWGGL